MTGKEARTMVVEAGDGTCLPVGVFAPERGGGGPVMVCVPAMGVRARSYRLLAETLAAAGCVAVTMDLRGHGRSPVRPSRKVDFGYHELISVDLAAMVVWARERWPDRSLVLFGHSLGGQLGALFAGAFPGQLDGLVLVAACSVDHRGWRLPLNIGVLLGSQLARGVADVFGVFPGKTLRFAGVEARGVIRDWSVNARTGRYQVANAPVDYEQALRDARTPTLSVSFEVDALAPQRACRNLLAKLEQAPITEVQLDRAALGEHTGHFGWLKSPGIVTGEVMEWVRAL